MCYCDYDPADVYRKSNPIARKRHRCWECSGYIEPGEKYEYVFGVWEGHGEVIKTCHRCTALRDFVMEKSPCKCWAHGVLIEEMIENAREHGHQVAGLLFGAYRRRELIYRHNRRSINAAQVTSEG